MPPSGPSAVWIVPLAVIGFLIGLPLLFWGMGWFLSTLGGWHHLPKLYTSERPDVPAETVSGAVGPAILRGLLRASYRSTLGVGVHKDGLYLECVMPFFKKSHPPLFIPWKDIHSLKKGLFGWGISLKVGHPTIATISIPPRVAEQFPNPLQQTT